MMTISAVPVAVDLHKKYLVVMMRMTTISVVLVALDLSNNYLVVMIRMMMMIMMSVVPWVLNTVCSQRHHSRLLAKQVFFFEVEVLVGTSLVVVKPVVFVIAVDKFCL